MNRIVMALLSAFLLASVAVAQDKAPELSELQKAKMEAHQLRVQLAQAKAVLADREAKLDSCNLTNERATLEADIVKDPSYRIDWNTLELVKQEPPKQ